MRALWLKYSLIVIVPEGHSLIIPNHYGNFVMVELQQISDANCIANIHGMLCSYLRQSDVSFNWLTRIALGWKNNPFSITIELKWEIPLSIFNLRTEPKTFV